MGAKRDSIKEDVIMCETLLRMFRRRDFRNDYPLQRRPESWSKAYQSEFIVSVIKNENIDSIKMCEEITDNGSTLWLIDGGNRVRALDAFKNGEFKILRSVDLPFTTYSVPRVDENGVFVEDDNGNQVYDYFDYDLRGKGYNDLPQELKDSFDSWGVRITKRLNATEELIKHDIRRYNNQGKMNNAETSMTYMHRNSAQYLRDIAEENCFFKECGTYRESERKRSGIERVIVESMIAVFYPDEWNKNLKKMNEYLSENATKEEFKRIENDLDRLEKIVDEESNILFDSKNTYAWLSVFHKFTELGLPDKRFHEFLNAFVAELHSQKVNGESWDDIEEKRNTKDKKIVLQKISILEIIMMDYLHIKKGESDEVESIIEFVRQNVDPDANEEDIELYETTFDDYTVSVDNNSPLLDKRNRPSWIALVANAFKEDTDMKLEEWMVKFFAVNTGYLKNQRDNFLRMRDSFHHFCLDPESVVV